MRTSEAPSRSRDACLVFLLSLPLFLAGLGDREFIEFECRFGLFAKEMSRHGLSFFPTVHGRPYPDYPGLQTALICLASLPRGKVTVLTAVLPTAVFASLSLVFTYLLGASRSRRLGVLSVLLVLATAGFSFTARSPSLDHFLAASTAFTAWAAWSVRRPGPRWALIALGLAVGFAFRGPLGLVVPASVVVVHRAISGDWKGSALAVLLSGGLLALGVGVLLLAADREGGEAFRRQVLDAQAVGRLSDDRARPIWHYWLRAPGVYAVSFPLAILAGAASWRKVLRRSGDGEARWLRFLLGWALVILIGLSVPAAKKDRYILPVVPAASLLAASLLLDEGPGRAARLLRRSLSWASALAPVLGLGSLLLLAVPFAAGRLGVPFEFSRAEPLVLFAFEAAAAGVILSTSRGDARRLASLLALGVLALATLQVYVVEPLRQSLESSRAFVAEVEGIRGADPLVFFRIGPDEEDVKYAVNLERDVRPLFLGSLEEVAALEGPACIVAEERSAGPLRERLGPAFRLLAEGKLGHRRCIAFALTRAAGR